MKVFAFLFVSMYYEVLAGGSSTLSTGLFKNNLLSNSSDNKVAFPSPFDFLIPKHTQKLSHKICYRMPQIRLKIRGKPNLKLRLIEPQWKGWKFFELTKVRVIEGSFVLKGSGDMEEQFLLAKVRYYF